MCDLTFFYKDYIEDIISHNQNEKVIGTELFRLFKLAVHECKIYEDNDLTPLIGVSDHHNPPVIVTSKERLEGQFIQ